MDSMRKTGHRDTIRRSSGKPLLAILGTLVPVLALLVATPATAGAALDRIKQAGTLKLGYGPDNPLSRKDGSGSPSGFAIDLCNKVAEGIKADLALPTLKVEYVNVTREEAVAAVADGKVDVLCAPLVATTASRKQVSYSIPIFASGVGALVRRDASTRLKDTLSGRTPPTSPFWRGNPDPLFREVTVSAVKGSRTEAVVAATLKELQLAPRVVPVDDNATGAARVLDGSSNVFFGDRVVLLDAARQGAFTTELELLDRFFTYETLAFAMSRGDEDLRLTVDSALSKVFRSGDLPALFVKWFGRPPSADALTTLRASAMAE